MINLSEIDALPQLTDQASLYRQLRQQIDDLEKDALDGLREVLDESGINAVRLLTIQFAAYLLTHNKIGHEYLGFRTKPLI